MDRMIDALDDFGTRLRLPISIVASAWLILSWAASARFITLPEIALLTGMPGIIASSAINGIWWGWLNPRLSKRRAERMAAGVNEEAAHG